MRLLTLLFLFIHLTHSAQCDLVLTDVDIEDGTFTIEFLNTTSCGGTGGPDGVSEIQIGFQALDPDDDCSAMNQGWSFPSGVVTSDNNAHPGWVFSSTSTETPTNWTNLWPDWPWDIDPPYYAGETITFPLYNQYQTDCVDGPFANGLSCQLEDALNFWLNQGLSIQAVIWQISYGPTMYADEGGWAEVGGLGDGTTPPCCGIYDDENFEDNWIIIGPCADPSPGPDAVIDDITFEVGCIGDTPAYQLSYTVWNYGDAEITDYCIEIWNEDYYQCFDSELFGNYSIPVGEGQLFTTPFFEYDGQGSFFTMSVDNVNDEIVTGNNNTTIYYPDTLENLVCPEVCEPDTIIEYVYDTIYVELPPEIVYDTLTIIDVVDNFIYDTTYIVLPPDTVLLTEYVDVYVYDTTYIELPPDTLVLTEYVDVYVYDTTYIELPPDTIIITEVEYLTDTLYVDNYIYEYDTIYVDVPYIDTIYVTETEYVVDTLYVTEYVTITDTITEYIVQELWIDCNTGLPCGDEPPGLDCPDWTTIHIPNTFTPNNDGVNDVWQIVYDLNCWEDVEFKIYNRWGNQLYEGYGDSFDSYPFWDGSVDDGDHFVPDGIYYYLVRGKKVGRVEVVEEQGHITIFR